MGRAKRVPDSSTAKPETVTMESMGGQTFEVSDPLDREFLESADRFRLRVREILNDPSRRRPRLPRWWE